MASFAGITTAVATIMTSASAVLGLLVHHQSVQLQQAHATVSQQARQINALKDDVAGSGAFTAEAGIADNAQNATNDIATVIFSNESGRQIGTPIQVSLGHPMKVRLSIAGVTQLGMSCAGRKASTNQAVYNFDVSLGNAGVS